MTGKTLVHIIIAVMAVLLTACHRTAPQRPSQRLNGSAPEADSASLAILTLNQCVRLIRSRHLDADREQG